MATDGTTPQLVQLDGRTTDELDAIFLGVGVLVAVASAALIVLIGQKD